MLEPALKGWIVRDTFDPEADVRDVAVDARVGVSEDRDHQPPADGWRAQLTPTG
jgi:hypothetical protein